MKKTNSYKRAIHYISLVCLLFLHAPNLNAQVNYAAKQRNLEQKKVQLINQIREVRKMLNTNQKKERNVLSEYNAQSQKIQLQQKLIANTRKQVKNLANDIYKNKLKRNKLKRELNILRKDYKKIITRSYKIRSDQSKFLYILSSEDLLQAYKRMQYLKQYAQYRKTQGVELKEKSKDLEEILKNLEKKKIKQEKIVAEQKKEQLALEAAKKIQSTLMAEIKKNSKRYKKQIQSKQAQTKKIDRQIKQLIQKSIEEANKRSRAKSNKKNKKTTKNKPSQLDMTPEDRVLAKNFKSNKRKLPWPVTRGFISLKHGDQPHPSVPSLTIHNSGIEITTEPNADIHSVFKGEVMNIQVIGKTKAVSIRHGAYITVYQNLRHVSVTSGQKVSTKQKIGTIGQNYEGKYILKFVLSKNTNIQNPESWLTRK